MPKAAEKFAQVKDERLPDARKKGAEEHLVS
jgi:hypothetical protein